MNGLGELQLWRELQEDLLREANRRRLIRQLRTVRRASSEQDPWLHGSIGGWLRMMPAKKAA